MKAELNINTDDLATKITQGVIKAIKPLLNHDSKSGELMNVEGLAKYLGVEKDWIYSHVKEMPHYKLGRFPKFRKKEIDKWLDTQKPPQYIPHNKGIYNKLHVKNEKLQNIK